MRDISKQINLNDCETINMLPTDDGCLRKRMGYHLIDHYPGRINGIAYINGHLYVHAYDVLYKDGDVYQEPVQNKRSAITESGGTIILSYTGPFYNQVHEGTTYYLDELKKSINTLQTRIGNNYHTVIAKLPTSENCTEACAILYNGYYIAFMPSNNAYAMNLLSKKVYPFTNINARSVALVNNKLYFGNNTGDIYEVYTDTDSYASYNDNGSSIECQVISPIIIGTGYAKKKDFKNIDIVFISPYSYTAKVYGRGTLESQGTWKELGTITGYSPNNFNFNNVNFNTWCFYERAYELLAMLRTFLGQTTFGQFKITNNIINQSFIIKDIYVSYKEGGRFY